MPESVLRAITRTETGRGKAHDPWPWTVNMQGVGKWFKTEDDARRYVFAHFKKGARSFDVGCFQINYKWHGDAFRSIDEMFDPLENARYAARFLARLYRDTGDWTDAAGAYHSRTPKYAKRYKARFETMRRADTGPRPAVQASDGADRADAAKSTPYPLFQANGSVSGPGSLVPLGAGRARALIALSVAGGS